MYPALIVVCGAVPILMILLPFARWTLYFGKNKKLYLKPLYFHYTFGLVSNALKDVVHGILLFISFSCM